ncbi:hypothetical protein V496_07830 [Pseudogymnoascus sp. VKM F-4515 (FW-2607)]|nr:hypothetical protein V496_07830 [Pseudogymnoascus sp. VKM F-4515 (FW-2607)]
MQWPEAEPDISRGGCEVSEERATREKGRGNGSKNAPECGMNFYGLIGIVARSAIGRFPRDLRYCQVGVDVPKEHTTTFKYFATTTAAKSKVVNLSLTNNNYAALCQTLIAALTL